MYREETNSCTLHHESGESSLFSQTTATVEHCIQQSNSEGFLTKEKYLYERGWANQQNKLHERPWVEKTMSNFHINQTKWDHRLCTVCHELWPTRTNLKEDADQFICTRCKRDKSNPKRYSKENDMDPGKVPACLQKLTQIEEMLIARACPIMCVYRKHGGQRGYKGHVINLPQHIQGFLDKLPSNVSDLPILIVRRHGSDNSHADFRVRRECVLSALQWLMLNNPCYSNITIDHNALQLLPEDGVPDNLLTTEEHHDASPDNFDDNIENTDLSHDSHSFLPCPSNEHLEDKAIRSAITGDTLDWPSISNQAINEYNTPHLATMAFPTLFPHGTGDPTNPARQLKVSLTDSFKHLIKYGEIIEGHPHWRFATHPRFSYWALNMKQCHQLLSQANIYLQQHPADANLTVEDLRAMVGNLSAEQLMKRLERYAAKIQGSSQYWFQRCQELKALILDKGTPTFFWTVSSADLHWPELHHLMPHPLDDTYITHTMRVQAVINNPHITDWYFTSKLSDFVDHWLYDTLCAEWHWYRLEYQARGSTHAHSCAKLKNDPGICSLVQKAATGWLAQETLQNEFTQCSGTEIADLQKAVQEGQEATTSVLEYVDWLVTTCNEAMPDETWNCPCPHPSAVDPQQIEDHNTDYHDLVNAVQRHTRCSTAYCLRRKAGHQDLKCRFDYPLLEQHTSQINFSKQPDGIIRATVSTKRNDPRVNSHNRVMLQHWRANVDVQIIVDVQACIHYMAKYAAKGEPRSQPVQAIFKSCVNNIHDHSEAQKALRSAMVRSVGERDFSAQETAHMLLSLPLTSCTFNFVSVSLTGSRKLTEDEQSGELVLQQSMFDHYATRENLPGTNLYQFIAKYTVVKGKIAKRHIPVIVRTFPSYSSNPHSEHYSEYCKYQLIKYKPWHGDPTTLWTNSSPTLNEQVDTITAYRQFLLSDEAHLYVPRLAEELNNIGQYSHDDNDSEDENDSPQLHSTHQDDWMNLCRINQHFTDNIDTNQPSVDWSTYARTLESHIIRESAIWIKSSKSRAEENPTSQWVRQLSPVDTTTLSHKQLIAYNIIVDHYRHVLNNSQHSPLHMLIYGTAGTGKSYLIRSITQVLGTSCILTGTTGMAAFNICGTTVHSALKLPIHRSNHKDLQGTSLQQLQLKLKDKHYIIIDEMSMIGQRMLAWIDKRLRQASGQLSKPFGGLSIILIGDFGQLPPVCDRPLYANIPFNTHNISPLKLHGYTMYQLFQQVVILDQIFRQSGTDPKILHFKNLLSRLRDGQITLEDWHTLLSRTPDKAANTAHFTDAVRLYYDRESTSLFNLEKLQSLGTPIATIKAIHSSPAAASAKPDDAGGLYPTIHLAKGARVMLTTNLWQQVGLCNGAAGTVHEFIYVEGQSPPNLPIAVLVNFDDYIGPIFLQHQPKCIPIPPITSEWQSTKGHHSRQQIPLLPRHAITIHKSQGQTLQKAVIDIGKAELSAGCTFVALSRVKSLEDILIQPMSFERLQAIARAKYLQDRKDEELRLQHLATSTQQSYANVSV